MASRKSGFRKNKRERKNAILVKTLNRKRNLEQKSKKKGADNVR